MAISSTLIEKANALIEAANGGHWHPPSNWSPVPAAFSRKGRGRKYWKTGLTNDGVWYFYGPLDFTVFFLPDTVAHQSLQMKPPSPKGIALMEIPEHKLKRENLFPPEAYLRGFQGIFADVFNIAILPCSGLDGNVLKLDRANMLFDSFSPLQPKVIQEQHRILDQITAETKRVVTETVKQEKGRGALFKKEKDVASVLEPVVNELFTDMGYAAAETRFKGLWRSPNCDHVFTRNGRQWPEAVFVEFKCDVDIKAPLVQVAEDLASAPEAAVLQVRVPGKPTGAPALVAEAKRKMEASLPVRYIEVAGW